MIAFTRRFRALKDLLTLSRDLHAEAAALPAPACYLRRIESVEWRLRAELLCGRLTEAEFELGMRECDEAKQAP